MALIRRSVRRFTSAESFRLFMEGVRSLQHYDKKAAADPSANEDVLNKLLGDAEKFFQDCVNTYSNDILPRYYLGIVLSIQAQIEQARTLRLQIEAGTGVPVTSDLADAFFRRAANEFARVVDRVDQGRGGRDLLVYAQYNEAQALAKMGPLKNQMIEQISKRWQGNGPSDDGRPWDVALLILQKIDPHLVLTNLTGWEWLKARLRFVLRDFGFEGALDSWLSQLRRDPHEVSAGVSVPLKAKQGESRAFELQVLVLEYAIQIRKAVYGKRELTLEELPQDKEMEQSRARGIRTQPDKSENPDKPHDKTPRAPEVEGDTVRTYIAEIEKDEIRSPATNDIVADYWNKLAFVAWEKAALQKEGPGGPWLQQARKYIDIAMKGRPNWTPGQLNRARIEAMEGNKDAALQTLERVLGKKVQPPAPAAPSAPPTNSQAIATLIQSMNMERDPKVIASLIERSYGPLSQQTIREVTVALAGKMDAKFLDEIFDALPIPKTS